MEVKTIEEYIQLLNDNNLSELEIKMENFELKLKKAGIIEPVISTQTTVPQTQTTNVINDVTVTNSDSTTCFEVKTPLVGVVYLSPEPGTANFVKVGDTVKTGDKLAIISAMKVMNDLIAPTDGIVKEICVNNEDVVEFDQTLFIIE